MFLSPFLCHKLFQSAMFKRRVKENIITMYPLYLYITKSKCVLRSHVMELELILKTHEGNKNLNEKISWAWCHMTVSPSTQKAEMGDQESEAR